MKNEKGFSLIEVLAGFVIISFILLSFMQVFVNTSRLANNNSEKLVVVNLAHAYLERLKINPYEFIEKPSMTLTPKYKSVNGGKQIYSASTCSSFECDIFETIINDQHYEVQIVASQSPNENKIGLVNIEVTIKSVTSSLSSSVEGYITDAKVQE